MIIFIWRWPAALQHFHEQEHICHTLYNFKAWTFLHLPRSFFFLGHNFMVQRTLLKLLRKKKFSQTAEMAFFIHPLLELRDSAREIMNEFLILAPQVFGMMVCVCLFLHAKLLVVYNSTCSTNSPLCISQRPAKLPAELEPTGWCISKDKLPWLTR